MNTLHRNKTAAGDHQIFSPQDVFHAGLMNHHIANTAYPIAHTLTTAPYRIPNSQRHIFAEQVWKTIESFGLYAHVPFCEHVCGFCEYTVVDPQKFNNEDTHSVYFRALAREIQMYAQQASLEGKTLEGFDIGGGTPSAVDPHHIKDIMNLVHKHFSIPHEMVVSLETTPKIAATQRDKIQAYHDMGINRISMGVQDINPQVLASVGRTTTGEQWNYDATHHIRNAGFNSFNVDIMYGLTHQTTARIQATLEHVLRLDPDHITLYRTRYKGTKLQEKGYRIELDRIQEQYDLIKDLLIHAGYSGRIGKNTFSKKPNDSGASDYLTKRVLYGTPYLGVGLGSQSYTMNMLSYNQGAGSKDLQNYLTYIYDKNIFPLQDIYHLSKEMSAGKFISVSFYFGGIDLASFYEHFGMRLEDMFPEEIKFISENGYMQYENGRLQLTEHGNRYYNGVIALFYASSIKQVLLDKTTLHV